MLLCEKYHHVRRVGLGIHVSKTDPSRYSILMRWSDEDGGYIATVPEFPGCSAFGTNRLSALIEISFVMEAWVSEKESGKSPVPPPDTIERERKK